MQAIKYNCSIIPVAAIMSVSVCQESTLNIVCPAGSSINLLYVMYGRQDTITCPHSKDSDTNCASTTAMDTVKSLCDSKSACIILAGGAFGDPCYGTYKYLAVNYTCSGASCYEKL